MHIYSTITFFKKSILNLDDFDHTFPKSLIALHGRLETPVPNKFQQRDNH